ncbi:MAG: 3'-5' exonuclease [Elusimicrobiaceae bacterium]|nr:3'-5' exonuclease [Elusimicrobiaceae bacterium]
MHKTRIEDITFAFVDIETTGLSPRRGDRVCEVAVLKNRAGETLDSFVRLVNPGCPIPPQASAVHRITDDMVSGEPRFEAIAPALANEVAGCVIVCHNASFDVPFLEFEFGQAGLRFPAAHVLDTLKFARRHGGFQSNRLGNIATALGYCPDGWHRALADVKMTEFVFLHFLNLFREKGARTLDDLKRLELSCKCDFAQ